MIHKKSLASTPPRLQRMLLRLQHYDVSIKYRPGKEMVLADSLSRLSPIPDKEIHLEQSIYADQFTHDKLQQLKLESESDPEVTAIRNIIIDGWPDSAKQLPKNLREFWSCKDELSVEDGLVLKGERVLIPTTMRSYILQNIHAGHQGMEKCKLRAKTCVYWIGISANIERTVKTCSVCQTNQSSQQAETLLPHDIPDGPWQVLATDIFHLDGNDYGFYCWLLLKDALCSTSDLQLHQRHSHLSSEAAVWRAWHTTQTAIWQWTAVRLRRVQDICSRLGIQARHKLTQIPPVQRICRTHGPDCQENHAQGKAEQHWSRPLSAVPTHHPHRQQPPLPCQLLYSRQLRSNLPLLSSHTPQDTAVHKNLQARQRTQKKYHDRSARDLPPLHTGQHVRLQEANGTWTPATVVKKRPEPRSYTVRTPNGGLYRRNRRQLRDFTAPPKHITWADQTSPDTNRTSSPDQQQQINMPATTTAPPPKADSFTPSGQTSDKPAPAQTPLRCSSRHTKPPQRLIESM